MNDVVLAFGRRKVVEQGAACLPESGLSSCCRLPEQGLELGKELLDRVEIRGIGREVKHAGPCRPDRLLDPGDLVNSQVVHRDHVARLQHMDGARFVFIDETAVTTAMTRLSGWGPRGERLVDAVPAGHWKTTTVVAGLRASGIIAPFVLDGPMTGAAFRAYVEQVLAPALEPGDVVTMDNLAVHKVAGVQEAIRAAGASVLYLRSYSPDFNPIEQLFAKVKALLRKAAARTQTALWETSGTLLDDFTPAECQNYIVHSGYEFV